MENVYAFNRNVSPEERRQGIVDDAHDALKHSRIGLNNFPTYFLEVLRERVWEAPRKLDMGEIGALSFEEFIRRDYPIGLGSDFETVEAVIQASPVEVHRIEALALWTELTKRKPGRPKGETLDNIQDKRPDAPTGTSAEAGLRRLAKEADAGNEQAATSLAEVKAGTKSVHRAMQDCGFRKRVDPDVRDRAAEALAERIVANFPADELDAAKADAFACGAKALGIALTNLIGQSVMDRRYGGAA